MDRVAIRMDVYVDHVPFRIGIYMDHVSIRMDVYVTVWPSGWMSM